MLAVASLALAPLAVAPNASSMPLDVSELGLLGGRHSAVMLEGGFFKTTAATDVVTKEGGVQVIIDEQLVTVHFRANRIEDAPSSSVLSLSTGERLDTIKNRLGISITQLADLLGVTRKAIYDWYDGAAPRTAMIGRINSLTDAIAEFGDSDLKRLKAIWGIDAPSRSFRSTLQNDTLVGPQLTAALVAKLNELSDEMAAPTMSPRRTSIDIGSAHLADIDRHSDSF